MVLPSGLKNTIKSSRDKEFDEILSNTGNMSEDEFLSPSQFPNSSPRRVKEPIPANRIALVRKIEEENRQLRQRQRLRELGYKAILVLAVMVSIALLTIAVWLFYIAATNPQVGDEVQPIGPQDRASFIHIHDLEAISRSGDRKPDFIAKDGQGSQSHIISVPKKLSLSRMKIKTTRKPNHSLDNHASTHEIGISTV